MKGHRSCSSYQSSTKTEQREVLKQEGVSLSLVSGKYVDGATEIKKFDK